MVSIAICGDIVLAKEGVENIVAQCTQRLQLPTPTLMAFPSPFALLEHLDSPIAEPLFDLLILQASSSGMSAIQAVRDARKSGYAGEIILVEDTDGYALEARRWHVTGYLVEPVDADVLTAEIAAAMVRLQQLDAESTTMRMRGGVKRVLFSQLVFAQTSNHDQVLHMRNGTTMQLRCSSQELFDRLSHDERFLKLGSSYIVNLDLVRSFNSNGGTLSFVENSTASVPVRFRKTVQDALFARAEWRKHA